MPVQLPNQPQDNATLPALPHDPPTLRDIADAVIYSEKILVSHNFGGASRDDIGRADLYRQKLIGANPNAQVPAWFAGAVAGAVGDAIQDAIQKAVEPIEEVLADLMSLTYSTYNSQCGDGLDRSFKILPFDNGTLPTDNVNNNLPGLTSIDEIVGLTGDQATS